MSKFKVGDKVSCVKDIRFFTNNHGKAHGVVSCVSSSGLFINIDEHGIIWSADMFELADDWSIYNNTKPLSELANEQAGELFKHEINGGILEKFSASGWHIYSKSNGWKMAHIYRAKQKTERELFIEAGLNENMAINRDAATMFLGKLFDADFKSPKVGE